MPENYISPIVDTNSDLIIIVDAVDFGDKPGTIKVFSPDEIDSCSLSTLTLSLTHFIEQLKRETHAKIFILGIQVNSCKFGEPLRGEGRGEPFFL
ncbi:hydrogenase maturation protease [candidate division WOR-3 bacterium]|nr:hydrogenase maturation protease [candidate division WOR-3 bacterium]